MTQDEREASARKLRKYIVKASAYLPDEDALEAVQLFAPWKPDTAYKTGDRVQYDGILYKCRQPHTSQIGWEPNVAAALWERITLDAGTYSNPIQYGIGMKLVNGKYYAENSAIYVCIRDSQIPVYNPLSSLIGIYVNTV